MYKKKYVNAETSVEFSDLKMLALTKTFSRAHFSIYYLI